RIPTRLPPPIPPGVVVQPWRIAPAAPKAEAAKTDEAQPHPPILVEAIMVMVIPVVANGAPLRSERRGPLRAGSRAGRDILQRGVIHGPVVMSRACRFDGVVQIRMHMLELSRRSAFPARRMPRRPGSRAAGR